MSTLLDYLKVIHIEAPQSPSLSFLSELQKKHIESLGWDTLDLFLGRPISLDPKKSIRKFITETRGGICYELNGAFCYMLRRLGFHAYLASAHVYGYNEHVFNFSMDTHAIIIVLLKEKRYLVDVGWGHSYRKPILINQNVAFSDLSGNYRLQSLRNCHQFLIEKFCSGEWKAQYQFSLQKNSLQSFQNNLAIRYSTIHPDGNNRKINCIKATCDGYLELKQDYFLIQEGDRIKKIEIKKTGQIPTFLRHSFGMHENYVSKYFCNF